MTKETTPTAGGSYIRTADGGLQLVERTQEQGEQASPEVQPKPEPSKKRK